MSDVIAPQDAVAVAQSYHERTKHRLSGYATGPDTLDWDAQPDPFRRYTGAPLTALPLKADALATPWADLFEPGRIAPRALDRETIGLLFELSFALSAWKQYGPDRWAMRVNPSSGNLHPTEAWLVCQGIDGIVDGVHHYAAREHALEQRATFAQEEGVATSPARALIALTSIQWREAWKYGERAFRYCQLDAGPDQPRVHVLLFPHRVDGLAPGAYLLPRSGTGRELLRRSLPATLDLRPVPDGPVDAPLLRLAENPALAGTLRTLNCHQALGADAILSFALLAEFNPLPDATAYRQRLQEAGLIGQALYLEAEAMDLRGTGIGCFFDDALHQLIGLPEPATSAPLQSVYHFTVGLPLDDARIATAPSYAHLQTNREGIHRG